MPKLKCIIVEDEPLAVKVLSDYVKQVPFLQLEGCFKDAIVATEWLRTNEVQLMFLDIHLPKLKGMAFLRTLAKRPAVIITTAYHQYAVEGFDLNVTDYLLKPIAFERFLIAVNKIGSTTESKRLMADTDEAKDYLFITVQKRRVKILFADILYVESQKEYIKVVTVNKEFVTRMSTHEMEAVLPGQIFKRIHRSFIISMARLESYTAESVQVGGIAIPIGRGYREIIEDL